MDWRRMFEVSTSESANVHPPVINRAGICPPGRESSPHAQISSSNVRHLLSPDLTPSRMVSIFKGLPVASDLHLTRCLPPSRARADQCATKLKPVPTPPR